MPFSRGSSQPRDRTHVSYVSCIGRQILYHGATWEAQTYCMGEPAPPTPATAGETLGPLPSLGEILLSAAHPGLHVKPALLPWGRERSGRSPGRLGGS